MKLSRFTWKDIRSNYAFLISLSIHAVVFIWAMSYPIRMVAENMGATISVEWVKNVPFPQLKEAKPPKLPLDQKIDPKRDIDSGSKKKTVRVSDSKLAWVLRKSNRFVDRSVEINKFQRSETIPELMTAVQIKNKDSSLSSMISTKVGPIDGNGIVGNQVRAKGTGGLGTRSGASILGLGGRGNGTGGDGLGGGSGNGGGSRILDRLGIINFMDESQGVQKVIYCLDVSASMAMGSKLEVSIRSIKESLLQLGDFDKFNIVTFYSNIQSFKSEAVSATMENIEKANRFLDSFTTRNIENNMGTDILAALKYALRMDPAVIVLVTDIQPTRGEVDENKIAEEVKKINKNTRIYGVGIEVWEPAPNGRLAKLLKMLTEQNNGEMKLTKSG